MLVGKNETGGDFTIMNGRAGTMLIVTMLAPCFPVVAGALGGYILDRIDLPRAARANYIIALAICAVAAVLILGGVFS